MRLALGTKLGPYEILAALGAGGMGEVYRARDARLGRDVTLKVLLSAVSDDPSRIIGLYFVGMYAVEVEPFRIQLSSP